MWQTHCPGQQKTSFMRDWIMRQWQPTQKVDLKVQEYCTALSSLQLEDSPFGDKGITIFCDTTKGQPRPVVPAGWRRQTFDIIHGLSHPFTRNKRRLIASKFVWHGLNKQVEIWEQSCIPCQSSKVHQHIKAPFQPFHIPGRRFDHIDVDLVGPLPPFEGFTHACTHCS